MEVKILKNINEFKDLEKSWNTLYDRMNSQAVFQSFEFNYYSWFYELNNDKNILTLTAVYDETDLTAVFPFYIDNRGTLRFINDNHTDFCDCLASSQFDLNVLLHKLKLEFSINRFNFLNLRYDAKMLENIKVSSLVRRTSFGEYSILELSKGVFPDNVAEYKSKQKTEFRRILKKNKEKTHEIVSANNSLFPFKEIKFLREKMIALGIRDNRFLPSSQLKLIEKLYQKGKIILSIVRTQKTINAMSFIIKDSDQYLIWIDMYDKSKMINIFNYVSLVTLLSSNRSVSINFGRGTYSYKVLNFLPERKDLFLLQIFSSRWQVLKYNFESNIVEFLRVIYKRVKK